MPINDIASYNVLFFESANSHINSCEELLSGNTQNLTNKTQELFRHIHSLKGSSATMGFSEISDMCESIIGLLQQEGNVNESHLNLEPIKVQVEKLKELLKSKEASETEQSAA